jgi:autotransporter-associated beta strand protein
VVKTGPGTQYLGGNDTYGGGTTVAAGTLVAGASAALGTGTVTVHSGAALDLVNNSTLTNPLVVQDGATLGGVGTFNPGSMITIQNGSLLSPDGIQDFHPIATLSFGTGTPVNLGPNGGYQFDIMNATGVAGTDYDTISVAGALSISSTTSNPFTIYVRSINPSTGDPGMANFNSSQSYSWTLLTAGSLSGFSSLYFAMDTSQFQNPTDGGQFSILESGSSLMLDFTPIPEPSTWALMATGLGALAVAARRRQR